jgi:CelD/BcsL family acetyltransferase involved in cellulose biosynthesis
MILELVRDEQQLLASRDAWTALHHASGSQNPFLRWEWVWHWWHDFRRLEDSPRSRLHMLLFKDAAGVMRGAAPFVLTTRRIGPASWRTLRLMGSGGGLTELRGFLVSPGCEHAVAAAFTRALVEYRRVYDRCVVDGLVPGTALHAWFDACAKRAGWTWGPDLADHVVALPATWEEFRRGLRRNIKESLRHSYNSLARDGYSWRFDAVAGGPDLQRALDCFFELHAARARMERGRLHENRFATPRHQAFLRAVAESLTLARGLVAGRLWIGDRVVAVRLGLVSADSLYLYFSGYDPAWAPYGVATTVTAELLKMAIAAGVKTANLSVGTDVSKTRWGSTEIRLRRVHIPAPTARARVLSGVENRVRRAITRLRRSPSPRRSPDNKMGSLRRVV